MSEAEELITHFSNDFTMKEVDVVIAHFGVPGMRWGVRKRAAGGSEYSTKRKVRVAAQVKTGGSTDIQAAPKGPKFRTRPQDVKITKISPRGKIRTKGGKKVPASEEAVVNAVRKQIAKKSGIHALSNADLKALNERMNLEQGYNKLSSPANKKKKTNGQKFIEAQIKKHGPKAFEYAKAIKELDALQIPPITSL